MLPEHVYFVPLFPVFLHQRPGISGEHLNEHTDLCSEAFSKMELNVILDTLTL